ncbi:conserved hypothetical protein [Dehalogenimonas lykanthroporepellens BL-DC-9]|nr:conserved hypothetical protein [Dehalogenimonas lykanthroporepellens BL-DC-9]
MRPLTDTLAEAQRAPSGTPFFRTAVTRRQTVWQELTGGGEDGYRQTAALTTTGTLVRARLTPPADSGRLFLQRVSALSPTSDFSVWQDTGRYGVNDVALADGAGEVSLCWLAADRSLWRLWSPDDGLTWQGPELVDYAPASALGGLSAAYDDAGGLSLFFTDQTTLYIKRRSGGVWQARQSWDKATGELTGVAAVYDGGWRLAVTGRTSGGDYRLWTLSWDGTAWSALTAIAASPAGEGYEFARPSLCRGPRGYLCAWVERLTGDAPHNRIYIGVTVPGTGFDDGLWQEPYPADMTAEQGVSLLSGDGALWATAAFRVWRAGDDTPDIDLSPYLKAVSLKLSEAEGRLSLELDNAGSWYDVPPFGVGDRLEFSAGYVTATGPETAPGLSFTITGVKAQLEPGLSLLILDAADGWSALKNWRAPGQLRWNMTHSITQILAWLLGRVGLRLNVSSASADAGRLPDFAVSPGVSGFSAVRRLLAGLPDRLLIEGENAWLVSPPAEEVPVYEWVGPHAVFRRYLAFEGAGGEITGPPNCAQQIHDLISVGGRAFRVAGIGLEYRASSGRYRMTLRLGE